METASYTGTKAITKFEFKSAIGAAIDITTITDLEGNPWFVAKEICDVLGYANSRQTISDHCKHSIKDGVSKRDAIGREQKYAIIPESDLYRLIMRSQLPAAEAFQDWVTDEVLPSIRKTGAYVHDDISLEQIKQLHAALGKSIETIEVKAKALAAAEAKLIEQAPKVTGYDNLIDRGACCSMSEGFKLADIPSPNKALSWMRIHGWLTGSPENLPTAKMLKQWGKVLVDTKMVEKNGGVFIQTVMTPSGIEYYRHLYSTGDMDIEAAWNKELKLKGRQIKKAA